MTNEGNTGNEVDHDKKSLNVSVGRADAASGHSGDTISRFEDDTRSISMMVQDDAPVRSSTLKRQSTKSTPRKKAQAGTHGGAATLFQKLRFRFLAFWYLIRFESSANAIFLQETKVFRSRQKVHR